jgi:hypothetical protein
MKNKVMKQLIDAQHRFAKSRGHRLALGDEQMAASLLEYFAMCPICKQALNFNPRIAVARCKDRRQFIALYGQALGKHQRDHPQCTTALFADVQDDPAWKELPIVFTETKHMSMKRLDYLDRAFKSMGLSLGRPEADEIARREGQLGLSERSEEPTAEPRDAWTRLADLHRRPLSGLDAHNLLAIAEMAVTKLFGPGRASPARATD